MKQQPTLDQENEDDDKSSGGQLPPSFLEEIDAVSFEATIVYEQLEKNHSNILNKKDTPKIKKKKTLGL